MTYDETGMTSPADKPDYSLRTFPPDLFAALGGPVAVIGILASLLLSLPGPAWLCAAGTSFCVAVLGAILLFIAKLPLYRQGRFFTFGIKTLPASSHRAYRWGCRCSVLGILAMLLLWLASTLWK
jgi:hypothetical protein